MGLLGLVGGGSGRPPDETEVKDEFESRLPMEDIQEESREDVGFSEEVERLYWQL